MPKVSIIIPCYNQGKFLDETLKSVYEQTYKDWECLMIDDGSTDNTGKIGSAWASKDKRFTYHRQTNQGVTKARDYGLDAASGEWIQFLDGDDLLEKTKFEKSLKEAGSNTMVITNFSMLSGGDAMPAFCDLTKYEINFQNLLQGWDIDFNLPIHCPLTHRSVVGNTRFRTALKAKEDWLFWLEIFRKNPRVRFINESLCIYRQHAEGASKNFISVFQDHYNANEYLYKNYPDEATRKILFDRLNNMLLEVNKTALDQKTYIRKLQSTKVLKVYLKIRKMFTR
jgi:glycosyltransferase involved in cell wall biosynthesis